MKHVIIGTAGHVDHGKTMLVKALTGTDTDRLPAEKARGITIELGFAYLDFDDGNRAGIVDVPGHEKFIKNMLSGAGGVDLAMLVVAADEGVMPQTQEHLAILNLLGIQDGLVVITKCDLVDEDWLAVIREEIARLVEDTFLAGKPMVEVSAYTGQGIPALKKHLALLVSRCGNKDPGLPFRLPIDRAFTIDGFGTVVTGTVIEGTVSRDELVELAPSGLTARVRGIQVHGQDTDTAYAGQRAALNLSGINRDAVQRGDTVAKPGSLQPSRMLDVQLQALLHPGRIIRDNSLVHLYHGARVLLSKVALLDRTELLPGDSCYAQLRLTEPLPAKDWDRFVIRFYSPVETIGGGVILDAHARKHKRGDPGILAALAVRDKGSMDERLLQAVFEEKLSLPDRARLAQRLNMDATALQPALATLVSAGRIREPLTGRYLSCAMLATLCESCRAELSAYHRTNPLHAGMKETDIHKKLLPQGDRALMDAVLGKLQADGDVYKTADRFALSTFTVQPTKRQTAIREKLLQYYLDAGLTVPDTEEILLRFPPEEKANSRLVLESLLTSGELIPLTPRLVLHSAVYARLCNAVRNWFRQHDTMTLAEFRDELHTSRKYAQAVLEYFDKCQLTKKTGDVRTAGPALTNPNQTMQE